MGILREDRQEAVCRLWNIEEMPTNSICVRISIFFFQEQSNINKSVQQGLSKSVSKSSAFKFNFFFHFYDPDMMVHAGASSTEKEGKGPAWAT